MRKYLLYKLNKNCAEIRNRCQNIAFSLGGHFFLTHPVHVCEAEIGIIEIRH